MNNQNQAQFELGKTSWQCMGWSYKDVAINLHPSKRQLPTIHRFLKQQKKCAQEISTLLHRKLKTTTIVYTDKKGNEKVSNIKFVTLNSCKKDTPAYLYKQTLSKTYEEYKPIFDKYNFCTNFAKNIVTYAVHGNKSGYGGRNKKIPQHGNHIRKYTLRCSDAKLPKTKNSAKADSIWVDLTPEKPTKGLMQLYVGDDTFIKMAYSIPSRTRKAYPNLKNMIVWGGGNLVPKLHHNKLNNEFTLNVKILVPIVWSYTPQGSFGIDIGKDKETLVAYSSSIDQIDIEKATEKMLNNRSQRQKLNQKIGARLYKKGLKNGKRIRNPKAVTTKERTSLRRGVQDTLKEHERLLEPIANKIIAYVVKNKLLLCIDNITTGVTNGEFGQALGRILIRKCINQKIPYISIPSRYLSRRCLKCGYVHPDNRNKKKFVCTKCGYKSHADINAAQNHKEVGWWLWNYDEYVHLGRKGWNWKKYENIKSSNLKPINPKNEKSPRFGYIILK